MNQFPYAGLEPREATPRITLESAAEVLRLIEQNGNYRTRPAIVIAVWTGSLVKYLIDNQQVEDTIRNLKKVAEAKGGD